MDDACSRTGEGEFAVFHFALVEGECAITKHHEAAVGELAGVVFMEIEDDFFIGKLVIADFHWDLCGWFLETFVSFD